MSDNNISVHIDKSVKLLDVDFYSLFNLTHDHKSLCLSYYGGAESKQTLPNNIYLSMEQDYLFATSKNKKSFMTIKIDNSTPLSATEITLAEILLKSHFYQTTLKKEPNLLNCIFQKLNLSNNSSSKIQLEIIKILTKVDNGEIEEIQLLPNGEFKFSAPKKLTQSDLEEITDAWENTPTSTKRTIATITPAGIEFQEENTQ